jgi:hypothetical protein
MPFFEALKWNSTQMVSNDNRPAGFYMKYLQRLAERRAAEGKPPEPDIAPEEYWRKRREDEAMKDLPPKKAA